jgi:hypothetical protein
MSKRQDIIDAVKTRLGTIKVTGGYYSNLGNNIYEWRDTDSSPIPVGNLPAINLKDSDVDIYTEVIGKWNHYMTLGFEIYCTHLTDVATEIRKLIADVLKAIGTDPKWGGLADYTDFETTQGQKHLNIRIETNEKNVARATFRLVTLYNTNYWVM